MVDEALNNKNYLRGSDLTVSGAELENAVIRMAADAATDSFHEALQDLLDQGYTMDDIFGEPTTQELIDQGWTLEEIGKARAYERAH